MEGPRNALLLIILTSLCLARPIAWAETGILVVHVKDVQRHPVAGLEIAVEGDGGSAVTDSRGKARIRLAPQTKEKSLVSLQIVKSPSGQDLVMVSPWDYRAPVPSFENESENFVEVVVVQRGDRAALENGTVLRAAVSQINKANVPTSVGNQESVVRTSNDSTPPDSVRASGSPKAYSVFLNDSITLTDQVRAKDNLEPVAKQYGLQPEELDKAIQAWGARTTDTYEAGLAALYTRNYDKATTDLQHSLKQREEKLAADQAADQKAVADAAFFLGSSLYEQGKYREAPAAYQRCLQIRPNDPNVLNSVAVSLLAAGDYAGAEPLMRQALAIDGKSLGQDHSEVEAALNNLAELLRAKGD